MIMKKITKTITIDGERIYLRKLHVYDVNQQYLSWMNDREVNRYLESRFQRWTVKKLKEYLRVVNKSNNNVFLAIFLKHDHKHIGNVKIGPIDYSHKSAYVGLIIGEKGCWGRGFGTEVLRLVTNFAFGALDLRKLSAGIYSNNVGSIKAFQKAGFATEHVKKKEWLSEDCLGDDVTVSISKKVIEIVNKHPDSY